MRKHTKNFVNERGTKGAHAEQLGTKMGGSGSLTEIQTSILAEKKMKRIWKQRSLSESTIDSRSIKTKNLF